MIPARILVVEDDSIIALELQDRLQAMGYTVLEVVALGEEAVERAAALQPALVLMDIRLAGAMDGVEAAAEIRARLDLPVVYLTAYADDHTLARARITEPYGYIMKPFEERELRTTIEIALYKHEMERKLRESEQWLSTTLASIGDAVIATGARNEILLMNPAAEVLTGWSQGEAMGRQVTDVFQLQDGAGQQAAGELVARALEQDGAIEVSDHVLIHRDGRRIPVEGNVAARRGAGEGAPDVVLVFRDVGERKRQERERERLQTQLLQAQKIEALGMLAGGIAHDFNNLMTTVIGYSSLALSRLGEDDPLRHRLESINRAGERAASLTQQLLTLSRKGVSQPEAVNLNDLLLEQEAMLRHLLGKEVELVLSLAPGLRWVRVDPAQVKRVVEDLVVNAGEAMPLGGTVVIETQYLTLVEDSPLGDCVVGSGRCVCLSVTDSGEGMDAETREHIFEPFFSTKEKGVGLGLSVAYGIARQHGGRIDVVSEPGEGATLRVCFPEVLGDPAEVAASAQGSGAQEAGERILVVEDEVSVRAAAEEMLRAGGYEVVAVGTVEQALHAFEQAEGAFDLVFSDLDLPDGNGLQLVEDLQARRPGFAVLLSSGHVDRSVQWPVIVKQGWNFLQKPYSFGNLLPAVRQVLAGR